MNLYYSNSTIQYPWILLLLICLPFISYAQPDNDLCEAAIVLDNTINYCSENGEFTNVDAQQSFAASSCFTSTGKDVWFKFTTVEEGISITVKGAGLGGTLDQPQIKLFNEDQCTGTFEELMCGASGVADSVRMDVGGLQIGQTYLFVVRGRNSAEGTFQLCMNNFEPIANDQCEGAISIPISNDQEICSDYSNNAATGGFNFSSCFSNEGQDVWFQFTALNQGLRLSVKGLGQGGTLDRPELHLFEQATCDATSILSIGCVQGNLSQIAAMDIAGLTPGMTYFFRVQGRNGSRGAFELCLENYAPPENDLCINATNLSNVIGYCSADGEFSNVGASKEIVTAGFSCLSEEGSDVWFRFRATYPTIKINVGGAGAGGSILRPELELFRNNGCDPNGSSEDIVACSAANTNNEASIDIGGLVPGDTYFLRVQGRRGETGDFKLCVDNIPGPSNDDCINPIVISDVKNFCSAQRAFSNIDAGFDPLFQDNRISSCLDPDGKDVWFSFIAEGTDVVITAIGATGGNFPGGSLENPEVELFSVDECNVTMNNFPRCGFSIDNLVNLKLNGLQQGREYLIRVQGGNGGSGTFQLCVNNFNPNFPPESDCGDARLLCDKSSIYVEVTEGAGDDPDEARNTCLGGNGFNSEQKSSWYKWRAANSEELTFVLTPDYYDDDLDWVLYELPNGFDNCSDKVAIRCMASGSNGGDFSSWRICMGPTGLRSGEDDIEEDPGCNSLPGESGDNAYLAPIVLKEGVDYALLINFFEYDGSSTDQTGFTIEFGGPGEFQGITSVAEITTASDPVCAGDEVLFNGENSSFAFGQAALSDYDWFFGSGASPISATGAGPHAVTYNTPGEKNISLTVSSAQFGCQSEELIESIVAIESCCTINGIESSNLRTDEICDALNGTIDMNITSNFPYAIQWNSGSRDEDLSGLEDGTYVAIITNTAECSDTVAVVINDVLPINVMPSITEPTCNGGRDGTIDLNLGNNVMVTWENPDSTRTRITNLPEGNYAVTIVDEAGCSQDMVIALKELELELDPSLQSFENPSCNGLTDGSISLAVNNGVAPYSYLWEGDSIGIDQRSLTTLPAGAYQVTVVDVNNCTGELNLNLEEPDPIVLDVMATDVSCAGLRDGSISAEIAGGVGGYAPVWTPNISGNLMSVDTGTYQLVVTDANGCSKDTTVRLTEPPNLFLALDTVENVICNGMETGVISVVGSGGNPTYEYSINGFDFQSASMITNLRAGRYTITMRDDLGCQTQLPNIDITEPDALLVDIYVDEETVNLGESTSLEADIIFGDDDVTYEWSPAPFVDCIDCQEVNASPVLPTYFAVTITDAANCTAVDSVYLLVNPNRTLYIPTAFTPGFDGVNDAFTFYGGIAAEAITLFRVFDRWGNLVYESAGEMPLGDSGQGWDGTYNGEFVETGVYVFYAKVRYIDGEEIEYEGDVTVVR